MPNYPQRRSPRQKGYDYTKQGVYFLTTCTFQRVNLFGVIRDEKMILNPAGEMLYHWWNEMPRKFPEAVFDSFIVMPNHIHALISLETPNSRSISQMMQWFKTMTTNAYIQGVKEKDWQPFERKIWQTSFHDKRVMSVDELHTYRHYIETNPQRWPDDTFYEE